MAQTFGPNLGLLVNAALGEEYYTNYQKLLRGTDCLTQLVALSYTTTAQPGSPADGDTYLIPSGATGAAWTGQTGKVARYSTVAVAWEFFTPKHGWRCHVKDRHGEWVHDGSVWKLYFAYGPTSELGAATTYVTGGQFHDTTKHIRMTSDGTNFQAIGTNISGVISGCTFTATNGGTVFSIAAGVLQFVDDYTTLGVPTITTLNYAGASNVTDSYSSASATYIGVNASGTIVQQTTPFTADDWRTIAGICVIAKADGLIIASASVLIPVYNSQWFGFDLYGALGPIVNGCVYSGIAGLQFARSSGAIFRIGSHYASDKKTPNEIPLAVQSPAQFAIYSRNNSDSIFTSSGILSTLTANKYDSGGSSTSGIPAANLTTNNWQAIRLWVSTNGYTLAQYGQASYASLDSAKTGVLTEVFYPAPITNLVPFRGYLFVRGGATNLNNPGDAVFVNASKLGEASSGSLGATGSGHTPIQFQEEGSNLGTIGTADTVNFTGTGVTASRAGNVVTVDIPVAPPAGAVVFGAHAGTTTSLTSTPAKINLTVEDFDTAGAFSGSRFTATTAGYYQVNFGAAHDSSNVEVLTKLYKNGAEIASANYQGVSASYIVLVGSGIVYLNGTTDYLEIYGRTISGTQTVQSVTATYLNGFLITSDSGLTTSANTFTLNNTFNAYTKLGSDAPAIKFKKLTGTTGANQGDTATVAHGLTYSKILAFEVLVNDGAGNLIKQGHASANRFLSYANATNIGVLNMSADSSAILSKAFTVLITYEE